MEVSLAVTQETTYNVEIHSGLNYQAWLNAGRVSKSFSSLDEVLEDEKTLRQLFLVHDAVDYVANQRVNDDLTKVFNTDLAAKWINNSDYALDKFYAVADIKTVMDTADKYGYGEWCLMPQVPKMISDTSPLGIAFANGTTSSHEAYIAFDGDGSTYWTSGSTAGILGYHFTSPVCIKKFILSAEAGRVKTFTLQGSNDGTNYTTLGSFEHLNSGDVQTYNVNNNNAYSYYRINISDLWISGNVRVSTLQFYAWAPKGNVPTMTANNAPYGTAYVSHEYQTNYAYLAFIGMDRLRGSAVSSNGNAGNYLYYKFTNPINVRKIRLYNPNNTSDGQYVPSIILKYSDDGTNWHDTTTTYQYDFTELKMVYLDVSDYGYHWYWAIFSTAAATGGYARFVNTQFYGRELKVSVPVMTSNTAPYGEASASSHGDSLPWKAFDKNSSTAWFTATNTYSDQTITYAFSSDVCVKKVHFISYSSNASVQRATTIHVQASKDNVTYVDLATFNSPSANANANVIIDISNNNEAYKYYQLKYDSYNYDSSSGGGGKYCTAEGVQFYGLDYSEKEFEVGTTKKWLYDHGVALVGITAYKANASNTAEKENNQLYLKGSVASSIYGFRTASKLDLTAYSLIRTKVGNKGGTASRLYFMGVVNAITDAHSSAVAEGTADIANAPNHESLSISSVNGSYYPVLRETNGDSSSSGSISEWWLE